MVEPAYKNEKTTPLVDLSGRRCRLIIKGHIFSKIQQWPAYVELLFSDGALNDPSAWFFVHHLTPYIASTVLQDDNKDGHEMVISYGLNSDQAPRAT